MMLLSTPALKQQGGVRQARDDYDHAEPIFLDQTHDFW
jgi:hypothetical protein